MFPEIRISEDIFVNRATEIKAMCDEIYGLDKAKVVFLCAFTGVGKTAFVKQVLKQVDGTSSQAVISVPTPPFNNEDSIEKYFYLNQCFERFEKKFQGNRKLSFRSYISKQKNKRLKKDLHNRMVDDVRTCKTIRESLFLAIVLLIKRLFKLGPFDYQNIFNAISTSSHVLKNEYIKYILSNTSVILNIDNFQNIDTCSFQCLLEWCGEFSERPNYFCLEYTLTDINQSSTVLQYANNIKDCGVPVFIRELEILESQYALSIIQNVCQNRYDVTFEEKALSYFEMSVNRGNLIKLFDFAYHYTPSKKLAEGYDSTLEKLRNIQDKQQLYILSFIILYGGVLPKIVYETVFSNDALIQKGNYWNILYSMCDEKLLKTEENSISIFHASIVDTWYKNSQEFLRYDLLAYKTLETYCLDWCRNKCNEYQSFDRNLVTLLRLYHRFAPEKILDLFNEMEHLMVFFITSEGAWEFLSTLVSLTRDKVAECTDIYLRIIKLCYMSDLFEKGYQCVEILESSIRTDQPLQLKLYKCMLLAAMERHEENLPILLKMQGEFNNNHRMQLNISLILMHTYRSLNRIDDCKSIAEEIRSHAEMYNKYPEYGYFFRLTDLYNRDLNDCLLMLEKGIQYFQERNLSVQVIKTRIAYTRQLALSKRLVEARYQLSLAQQELQDNHYIAKHMFLVNRAATELLSGSSGDAIWADLQEAEQTVVIPFDELAILTNKLVWCIENRSFNKVGVLHGRILSLLKHEPDKHIHAIIYYNLYVIFSAMGQEKNARNYQQKAWELRKHDLVLAARMEKKKISGARAYLLKKPGHVCFLAYWTYDILYDDIPYS